jgi:hypothetical protein
VARAELHRPDVEAILAAHCEFPNVRGIRHIVNWHPDPAKTYVTKADFLTDPAWLRGFALSHSICNSIPRRWRTQQRSPRRTATP